MALLKYRSMEVLILNMRFPSSPILCGVPAIRAGCAEAHGSDGAGSPEPYHGIGVFHQLPEYPDALKSEVLQLLAGTFGGLGGQAPELVVEVFVSEPAVEGGLADAGLTCGLGPAGRGGEYGQSEDLATGKVR